MIRVEEPAVSGAQVMYHAFALNDGARYPILHSPRSWLVGPPDAAPDAMSLDEALLAISWARTVVGDRDFALRAVKS